MRPLSFQQLSDIKAGTRLRRKFTMPVKRGAWIFLPEITDKMPQGILLRLRACIFRQKTLRVETPDIADTD